MRESVTSWAERLQADVDGIEGLITLRPSEKTVVAVVEAASSVSAVRGSLLERGVPGEMLEVVVVTDYLIPYPNDDERLMEWIEESGHS